MIKYMFKPFFKKYIGLFLSMVFVSLLSIALLCCFGSAVIDLRRTYKNYLKDYGDVDVQVSTDFTLRDDLLSVKDIEGVNKADARISLDCFLKKENRAIVARVFSYNETQNEIFKPYVIDSIEDSKDYINISVCRKFANNNNFRLGQIIKLGFFNLYEDFYISKIVETAEGIYPRANTYIWSDNQDFGYIYVEEKNLDTGIARIAQKVIDKIASDSEFANEYNKAIESGTYGIPDLTKIDIDFISTFANQILVQNFDGVDDAAIASQIDNRLKENSINVSETLLSNQLPYKVYMEHAMEQITVASVFLPVFFYSVTMIIIGLFVNQIIKTMTPQIGVLVSIGCGKGSIISLFLMFSGTMGVTSGILGVPLGFGLNALLSSVFKTVYSIPTIGANVDLLIAILAIVGLIVFSLLATFLSCLTIFKITPKDAVISNESKRKPLSKGLSKFIDKAPMTIKLATNSVAQNKKRFLVSAFSMMASMILILLCGFFYVSKGELIDQSIHRRLAYDCQVYLREVADPTFVEDLKSQSFVKDLENCNYTYIEASSKNKSTKTYLECLATDETSNSLIVIPDEKGTGKITLQEEGIILPLSYANQLKVKKGDTITLNNVDVKIVDISFQYFHPITYLSKKQMEKLGVKYVSTFILNVNDEGAYLNYMSENKNDCLTVFTKSLSKDLHAIFDTIDIIIYIMIGFSLLMSFIILTIMSQNTLLEQKRQTSVLRAIGFTVMNVSNVWSLQSATQLIVASLFGIPIGAVAAMILFNLCSNSAQIYPFIFSVPLIFIAFAFILAVVFITHLISMFTIKKWNLADNTRCRE